MQNSPTQPGVKPDSTTSHNLTEPATSNKTKLYGNGKTAGQIAIQYGYTGDLYGPGNSQPHKVQSCGHPHGIDVHALKSHAAQQSCASTQASHTVHVVLPSLGGVSPTSSTAVSTPTGGLLGAIASQLAAQAGVRGGVLGALAANGQGKLPFTGFPIWVVALIGLGLMALGLGVRHNARATI